LKIRVYQASDQQAIVDLWNKCGLLVPWNDPAKDIQRKILLGADLFLVGELEGALIASVMGGYEGHRGWANYLAVRSDYQDKGYARLLMSELETKLLEKGCPKINLQVRDTNIDIVRFYEALGYKIDAAVSLGKRLIAD
jgi:ribosomal protein S18 acetylase RimI-like enzyme